MDYLAMDHRLLRRQTSQAGSLKRKRGTIWLTRRGSLATLLCLTLAGCLSGCRAEMYSQARHDPLEASEFFADGRSARELVEGTVARGTLPPDEPLYTARQNGELVNAFPLPVTEQLLDRGQQRYNIFCSHCHGRDGYGEGMVIRRGFPQPPSFHSQRLREERLGHFFDVMTHGIRTMPGLGPKIPPEDRWAIAAYLRTLQRSQYVVLEEAPEDIQREFTD